MKLNNKTVLITGSNRGIGRALAEELAKYPVNLLLGMRDTNSYKPISESVALSITPVKMDLSSTEEIDKCIKGIKDIDKVDILINNAGQYVGGPLVTQDTTNISSMVQVNLNAVMHLTTRLLTNLLKRKEAKIVNNASIAGIAFFPYNSSYSATKAGVVGFSESLKRELAHTNVGVLYLITPGVDTQMMQDVESSFKQADLNLNLKKISPNAWAIKVIKAIERDRDVLDSPGLTGLVQFLARHSRRAMDLVSKRLIPRRVA